MRLAIVTFGIFSLAVFTFAGEWHTETVDTAGGHILWFYTSIALDTSDNPHISYLDAANYDLKHAYYNGSSWQIEIVDTEGVVGDYSSIALDTLDNPHISYFDRTNYDLKYAHYDGSSWHIESVDTAGRVGYYTSIALDTLDNPHISYLDGTNFDLKYAYYDGSTWHTESVDTAGDVGTYTSLALDTSNNPHISYFDDTNYDLKYAYYDGSSWRIEAVDTAGDVGRYLSLALDASDNPHISYHGGQPNSGLKYAHYDGSSWQFESVDTGTVGWYTSIALDTSDNPHISYHEGQSNYDLKYAYYDGSSWHIEYADTTGNTGNFTSIALDISDNPHISYAYYGSYDEDLKYAWREPEDVGIKVDYFSAVSAADGVEVSWECADEVAGFNLYRSKYVDGAKVITSRDKLNARLITGASPYEYLDTDVGRDTTYNYWLEVIEISGSSETVGPVECTWNGVLPTAYALYQSRPNPAAGTATIAFDLPEDAKVTLTVYDISGRRVTTVLDGTLPAGEHETEVSGLAPGVYVYKLTAGSFNAAKKMVVQ